MLTKTELIKRLAEKEGISLRAAQQAVVATLALITGHFEQGGDKVILRGFGTFKLRRRGAYSGVNPRTGEAVDFPARLSVQYKPSRDLKKALNG